MPPTKDEHTDDRAKDTGPSDGKGEQNPHPANFLVPWPRNTFIIRSAKNNDKMITLLNRQVVLNNYSGNGATHWTCIETRGWFRFRNTVTGNFLGIDSFHLGPGESGVLSCSSDKFNEGQLFSATMRPKGGCVLSMKYRDDLELVRVKEINGVEKAVIRGTPVPPVAIWEFIAV